jgi:hypothetical protein
MGNSLHLHHHQQQEEGQKQSDSITHISQPPRRRGEKRRCPSGARGPKTGLFFWWYSPGEAAAEGCLAASVRPREPLQHHGRRRTLVRDGAVPATGSRPTDQKLASGTRWPRNPSPSAEDRPTRIIWARVGRGRGAGEGRGQGIWREGGEKRMESERVRRERERASAGVGARPSCFVCLRFWVVGGSLGARPCFALPRLFFSRVPSLLFFVCALKFLG